MPKFVPFSYEKCRGESESPISQNHWQWCELAVSEGFAKASWGCSSRLGVWGSSGNDVFYPGPPSPVRGRCIRTGLVSGSCFLPDLIRKLPQRGVPLQAFVWLLGRQWGWGGWHSGNVGQFGKLQVHPVLRLNPPCPEGRQFRKAISVSSLELAIAE